MAFNTSLLAVLQGKECTDRQRQKAYVWMWACIPLILQADRKGGAALC